MGGAKGGRTAAEVTVRGFIEACLGQAATLGIARIGARAVDAVNRWVHTLGRTDGALNGMACTLSALVLSGRRAHVVHVGDSRVYRLRDDKLTLLTRDHTLGAPGTTPCADARRRVRRTSCAPITSPTPRASMTATCCAATACMARFRSSRSTPRSCKRAAPQETARPAGRRSRGRTDADNCHGHRHRCAGAARPRNTPTWTSRSRDRPLRSPPASGDSDRRLPARRACWATARTRGCFAPPISCDGRSVILKFPKPRPGLEAILRTALLRETWIASHVRSPFVTEAHRAAGRTAQLRVRRIALLRRRDAGSAAAAPSARSRLPTGLDIAIKLAKARGRVASRRHRPPRHQAGKRDPAARRRPQAHRSRRRAPAADRGHGVVEIARHAELHGAGTVRRRAGRREPPTCSRWA